jgi:hypothetical protein
MALYMETTKISVESTVADIQRVLGRYRCRAIASKFTSDGELEAVIFSVDVNGQEIPFRLPARWEPLFELINKSRSPRNQEKKVEDDREQAKRVAWRQILRWVEAQLALVQTNMVRMEEVFMPYVQLRGGQTLFDHFQARQFQIEDKRKQGA